MERKRLLLLLGGLSLLACIESCSRAVTNPDAGVSPTDSTGLAGLANSAWPCMGHDSRRTSQSPYAGTKVDSVKWIFTTGNFYLDEVTSPALGQNGQLYCGTGHAVSALSPTGDLVWQKDLPYYVRGVVPSIASDGTVYVGGVEFDYLKDSYGGICAINSDGSTKWEYKLNLCWNEGSPAIGPNGVIYIGDRCSALLALNPNGTLRWKFETDPMVNLVRTPSIAPNGDICICDNSNLYRVDFKGRLKWKFYTGPDNFCAPVVGLNNDVYVCGSNEVSAVDVNGTQKWRYPLIDSSFCSPALSTEGMLYTGSFDGRIGSIVCIGAEGSKQWDCSLGSLRPRGISLDADGNAYVCAVDSINGQGHLLLLTKNGSLLWMHPISTPNNAPAIGSDGSVYVGTKNRALYVFGDVK